MTNFVISTRRRAIFLGSDTESIGLSSQLRLSFECRVVCIAVAPSQCLGRCSSCAHLAGIGEAGHRRKTRQRTKNTLCLLEE